MRGNDNPRQLTVVQRALNRHLRTLGACAQCSGMVGPVVAPPPVVSKVYLIGQAPGRHEGALGRPFAWTAGKTLFRWFASIGLTESEFRERVYMAAVCRCFPGKAAGGGDRVPNSLEIEACAGFVERELELLQPELVLPVGRLAISRILGGNAPFVRGDRPRVYDPARRMSCRRDRPSASIRRFDMVQARTGQELAGSSARDAGGAPGLASYATGD